MPSATSPAYSDGTALPYHIETIKTTGHAGGKTTTTARQRWAVNTADLQAFLDAAPATAEGLELRAPQTEKQGPVTFVTLEYSNDAAAEGATLEWWTSAPQGLTFHRRQQILLSASESTARAALYALYNLQPNGAQISPSSDGIHATAELSWGPNAATGTDPETQPTPEPGTLPEAEAVETGFSTATSADVLQLDGDLAVQYRVGKANMEFLATVDNWQSLCAAMNAGSLIYAPNSFRTGTSAPVWQWTNGSALPPVPVEDIPAAFFPLLSLAAAAIDAGGVSIATRKITATVNEKITVQAADENEAYSAIVAYNAAHADDVPSYLVNPDPEILPQGIILTRAWKQTGATAGDGLTKRRLPRATPATSAASPFAYEFSTTRTVNFEAVATPSAAE